MDIYGPSTERSDDRGLTTGTPRVLVIDDDRYVLSLLCDLLDAWGYEVDGVSSPAVGLLRFRESAWDLVVTDLAMPGASGIDVVKQIRATNTTVGVILFTASPTDLDEPRQRLRFTLLRKPLEIDVLRLAVRQALEPRPV